MPIGRLLAATFFMAGTLFAVSAFAKNDKATAKYCEGIVQSFAEVQSLDSALEKIEQLESAFSILVSEMPDRDLSHIKRQIDALADLALSEGDLAVIKANARAVLSEMIQLFQPVQSKLEKVESSTPMIDSLIEDPTTILANTRYRSSHEHHVVVFSDDAVADLLDLDEGIAHKLLRSIQKGFVGAHSGGGIYRATDVHKAFFEVKYIGKSSERLLGCLEHGVLYMKKVISKRNEGAGGSLAVYRALCE